MNLCVFLLCFGAMLPNKEGRKETVDYVNPLMGTQSTYEFSTGNTYPAIARPWGMNFWMPQTEKMGDGWAYVYTANKYGDLSKHTNLVRGLTITGSLL